MIDWFIIVRFQTRKKKISLRRDTLNHHNSNNKIYDFKNSIFYFGFSLHYFNLKIFYFKIVFFYSLFQGLKNRLI